MSIKSFFGKGLASLLNEHHEQQNRLGASSPQYTNDMERMFASASPAVIAFKISNGYVVRTVDMDSAIVGSRQGGFTYCKDHQEIAEHIISVEAKRKLGIGEQQEMFDQQNYAVQAAQQKASQLGRRI